MSAKATPAKEIEPPVLSGEMVNINENVLPGHEIMIPKELYDLALSRYGHVLERNTLTETITAEEDEMTAIMHFCAKDLPKKPATKEVFFAIPGVDGRPVETILEIEQKEKLKQHVVKEKKKDE